MPEYPRTRYQPPAPSDPVNHPAHYGGGDNPYEVIKVITAWKLCFRLGNTVKYIARAGKKSSDTLLQDLKKAKFYLDHVIEGLEKKETNQIDVTTHDSAKSKYIYLPPEPGHNPCSHFPECGCSHIGQGNCGRYNPNKSHPAD